MTAEEIVEQLKQLGSDANCAMLSTYTIPWVAAESPHGRELALEWIESEKENVAAAGWATLSGWFSWSGNCYCFGGLASFTIAPCSSLITRTENLVTASRSLVLRLE